MKTHSCFRLLTNALTGAILFATTALQAGTADQVKVTDLMTKDLVNVPGKEVTMITVEYPPGGADPVHRHNANAFVYVLEGSIVMQMKGGEKVTLDPGDTFYEDPAGIHLVGKNASDTKHPRNSSSFLSRTKAHHFSFL
jgi:quercetin dioxygenase-like cupin family protein